tara:strand:+ start:800 stop:1396 length:597 start_codon:yes stop_codon:yes gene_type:complete
MKSFSQYITELFEKPYPYTQTERISTSFFASITAINNNTFKEDDFELELYGASLYKFTTNSKVKMQVGFDYDLKPQRSGDMISVCEISFANVVKNKKGQEDKNYDATMVGDEFKIMSTVMDIISHEISTTKPNQITFDSNKEEYIPDKKSVFRRHILVKSGRSNLYKAMVKRFAGKLGYKVKKVRDSDKTFFFTLEKN